MDALSAQKGEPVFAKIHVKTLFDQKARHKDIVAALKEVAAKAKREDVLVVSFSGNSEFDDGVWLLAHDADPKRRDAWISAPDFGALVARVRCRSQLIFLDTCAKPASADRLMRTVTTEARDVGNLADTRRLVICPTGMALELRDIQHGSATASLLQCLAPKGDLDGNGRITAAELEVSLPRAADRISEEHRGDIPLRLRILRLGSDFPLLSVEARASRGFEPSTAAPGSKTARLQDSAPRKDYALLFATDTYEHWRDLENPIRDAEALAKDLEGLYGFEVDVVKDPTKAAMRAKLVEYKKKKYGPDDQLFVFFAGHGSYDDLTGAGYIIARDSTREKEPQRAFSHSAIEGVLSDLPCEHVLVMLDVCFGGTFDKFGAERGRSDEIYDTLNLDDQVKRALAYKSRFYMTSGGKEYVPDGRPGRHSPFAFRLLDGLRRGAREKSMVSFEALVEHMRPLKIRPRHGSFGSDPGATFLFIRKP